MDLRFSDEQSLLKGSLDGWLERNYAFDRWRRRVERDPPYSERSWDEFAGMGLLGMSVPEAHGGLGLGGVERMIVGEAFGSRLVTEPYLSSAVLGAGILAEFADGDVAAERLPALVGGGLKVAVAFAERASRFSLSTVATRARSTPDGYRISGEKILVLDAPGADRLIVLARTSHDLSDEAGLSLFLVDPRAEGVRLGAYPTVDDRRAADVVFADAPAEALLGPEGGAYPAMEAAADRGVAYLCAEGVGAMQALYDATLAHVRTRSQFGRPIGDFQVIQHRLVDMRTELESARAMAILAASAADGARAPRIRAVSAAKVQVGRSARVVGREAIQLHGGIGMTNELAVGQYFKRLLVVETLLGDILHHQRRFAAVPSGRA